MFESNVETFDLPHTRPDIVVIDHADRLVLINEIAIPYDCHISKCFQGKFEKYSPLAQKIGALGYKVKTVVLLIGSMGSVHRHFAKGLGFNKLNRHEAKFLARFCSVSAVIGSWRVWIQRCRHLDDV